MIKSNALKTQNRLDSLATPLALLFLVMALLLCSFTIYMVFAMRWSGPFRDTWEFVAFNEALFQGVLSWQELFAAYGGAHRIVIPKLLFYGDFRFFHANNYLTCSLSLILQALSFCIYSHLLFKEKRITLPLKLALLTAVLFFLFSTTQLYNLLYAMDSQWFISTSCALLAFYFLFSASDIGVSTITICFTLALLAAFSNSTGLFIWPVLLTGCYLRGLSFTKLITLFLLCLCFVFAYTQQLHIEDSPDATIESSAYLFLSNLPATVFNMLRYLGLYLSSPLSRNMPVFGWLLSAFFITYLLRFWMDCIFKKHRPGKTSLIAASLASYVVLAGLATSWGRMYYPNSSIAERFQTIALQFQLAMLLLLVVESKLFSAPRRVFLKTCCVISFPLIMLLPYQIESAKEAATLSNRVYTSHTALVSGVTHIKAARGTLSHPLLINKVNMVQTHYQFLKQEMLGPFNDWPAQLMDQTLSMKTSTGCKGSIFSIERVSEADPYSGYKLKGRAINTQTEQPYKHLLIVDPDKNIIGLGRLDRKQGWLGLLEKQQPEKSTWTGFMPSSKPITKIEIYALNNDKQTSCLIARKQLPS
ncbi:MAG: hypothetical protein KDI30_06225 [Pseudomonadales bacterium]|nr:hypothetical protein [Pseudomonadales bacterium]